MFLAPLKDTRKAAFLSLLAVFGLHFVGVALFFWIKWPLLWGSILYGSYKAVLYGLPVVWILVLERKRLHKVKVFSRRGMIPGLLSGLAIAGFVWFVFSVLFSSIDADGLRGFVAQKNLLGPIRYLLAVIYLAGINAFLEEYVFRWFAMRQLKKLMAPAWAIFVSALIFASHHVVILASYFNWTIATVAAVGIFLGGLIWALLLDRYNSLWPSYVSHAFADLIVLFIGWILIF